MKRRVPWILALAIVLLLLGIRAFLRGDRLARPRTPEPSSDRIEVEPGSEAPPEPDSERSVARVDTPPPVASEPPVDPRRAALEGIVVDSAGAPVGEARVSAMRLLAGDNTLQWQLDTGFHAELEPEAETTTGADGRFRLVLPCGIPFDLEARKDQREGFAALRYAGDDVSISLGVEHEVTGRLTRASDGSGIEGALVRVLSYPTYATREDRSASDGEYRVAFPFSGVVYLEVLPRVEEARDWLPIELDAEGKARIDLVLPDGVAVVGVVREAETGRPLNGAIVGEGWQFRRRAVTDLEGRYRLAGIGGAGAYGLTAKASGHGQQKRMQLPAAVEGVLHVDFELPAAARVSGRVVGPDGLAVGGARVVGSGSFQRDQGQQLEQSTTLTDALGNFVLADLSPTFRHTLSVRVPSFAIARCPLPVLDAGEEFALGEIRLERGALVTGRVFDARGVGLSEAEVFLETTGFWASSTSDSRGRFALGDVPAGTYALHGTWASRQLVPKRELTLAVGRIHEGVELRLESGERLEGRVVDEHGLGIRGVNVFAQMEAPRDPTRTLEEAVFDRSGPDGEFLFEDLPPGRYALSAFPRQGVEADPDAPWLDGGLSAESGSGPVEIALARGAIIRGRLLDEGGGPLVNFSVVGERADGDRTAVSGTDARGRFELIVAAGTTWNLVVSGPHQGKGKEMPLLTTSDVEAGARDLELRLSTR